MGDVNTYLAVALYPIIVMFVFDWRKEMKWTREHKSTTFPPEIKREREKTGRHLFFLKFALLLVALWCLSSRRQWHNLIAVPVDLRSWYRLIAFGGTAAAIALVCWRAFLALSTRARDREKVSSYLNGSGGLWVGVFLFGGFAEEFWRAFCITSLVQNGQSAALANLIAALAFSLAHLSGLPPRIWPEGFVPETMVGMIFGGAFLVSGSVISACLASILYYSANLVILRKRYGALAAS